MSFCDPLALSHIFALVQLGYVQPFLAFSNTTNTTNTTTTHAMSDGGHGIRGIRVGPTPIHFTVVMVAYTIDRLFEAEI